jgi:hypothetical protein
MESLAVDGWLGSNDMAGDDSRAACFVKGARKVPRIIARTDF